ncbi:hypothetical protein [Mesorhizobium loti]|uniref:hypothetical protein n=1 Tax=Rhizobium loti TaxID=381 RepID=UPI00047AE661|nr:hypothetical protein [Mesorhizobium loti]
MSQAGFIKTDKGVDLRPIARVDVGPVANFLHENLNNRITPAAWASAIIPTWQTDSKNHGFMLVCDGQIVGVYLAFYSQSCIAGRIEKICNMAAWCVLEEFRSHGLRLVRAMLGQEGYTFTDLSPSGNVVQLNARLKFQFLDTGTALVANLPWPRWWGIRIVSARASIEAVLQGRDLEIYRDHAQLAAAGHLVIIRGDQLCYVMFRRDRRKGLPLFASILHVSNHDLFRVAARNVYSRLLTRFGILATLAETRIVRYHPRLSLMLRSPRPKMYRSDRLQPEEIDYLYSELVCVPW